jgi:hypothetical protein
MSGLGGRKLIDVKKLFFDMPAMQKGIRKAKLKGLSKAGAFVMRRARQSIRSSKKISQPGQPPRAHGQKLLKRNIFFELDKAREMTLVGPIFLNQINRDQDGQPTRGTVPSVLEYGGTIKILEVFRYGQWRRVDQRSMRRTEGLPMRLRTVHIAARPFMGPALEKEKPNFPAMLAGTFKK